MRILRILPLLVFLTLLTAGLNWYARKKVPDSYALQLSYNELYLDPDALRIIDAQSDENKLVIHLGGDTKNLSTNIPLPRFSANSTLIFNPQDNGRMFWIKQDGSSDSTHFSITFTDKKVYQSAGRNGKSNFEINSSSLVFSDAKLVEHDRWAFDFINDRKSEHERTEIKKYLSDSVGIMDTDPGVSRLQKIFYHLWPIVQPNLGVPADFVNGKSPLELITLLKTHRVKIWCGNISSLLGALTNAAGLPTRLVTTEGFESFTYPVHSFNEVYLPEKKTWIFTDLTTGVAYLEAGGKPLNTVQINSILRAGVNGVDVGALTFGDTIRRTKIDSLPVRFKYYFAAPQRFRYYFPQYLREQNLNSIGDRIKRFLKPAYNFAYFSENNNYASNKFLFRSVSTYLLQLFILMTAITLGIWLFSRK